MKRNQSTLCFTRYYQDDLLMGNEDYPTYCTGCGTKMDGGKDSIDATT